MKNRVYVDLYSVSNLLKFFIQTKGFQLWGCLIIRVSLSPVQYLEMFHTYRPFRSDNVLDNTADLKSSLH